MCSRNAMVAALPRQALLPGRLPCCGPGTRDRAGRIRALTVTSMPLAGTHLDRKDESALLQELEARHLEWRHSGQQDVCWWNPDPYSSTEGGRNQQYKDLINDGIAAAALQSMGGSVRDGARALVLDGEQAGSSARLCASGFAHENIFIPNPNTHVVHALRTRVGLSSAWAGSVEEYLGARDPARHPPFDVVFLDLTCFAPKAIEAVRSAIHTARAVRVPGGIIAVTCSTRPGDTPEGGGNAAAAHSVVAAAVAAARERGGRVVGAGVRGLSDYVMPLGPSAAPGDRECSGWTVAEALAAQDMGSVIDGLRRWVERREGDPRAAKLVRQIRTVLASPGGQELSGGVQAAVWAPGGRGCVAAMGPRSGSPEEARAAKALCSLARGAAAFDRGPGGGAGDDVAQGARGGHGVDVLAGCVHFYTGQMMTVVLRLEDDV
ncbi:unnamed protein product [Pedinophyceae sp. YPF-701]|nr:unnamed protein product [Pedinophyceae sp. YPF-701]